jgi:hypothetical protein
MTAHEAGTMQMTKGILARHSIGTVFVEKRKAKWENVEFSTEGGNGRIHCPLRLQPASNYLKTKESIC